MSTYQEAAARCNATFDMLRRAGEMVRPIHHWNPAEEPDFDRDEWQGMWGTDAAPH